MRTLFWALVLLLLSFPAFGANFNDCSDPTNINAGVLSNVSVTKERDTCYTADNSTLDDDVSPIFPATSVETLMCLNQDSGGEGWNSGAWTVMVQRCDLAKVTNMTLDFDNLCDDILDLPLDGTPGAPGTQNACVRVSDAYYRFLTVTAPAGTEVGYIHMVGEVAK